MKQDAPARCFIALGSNLGDRLAHLVSAIAALQADPRVALVQRSGLYRTAPVGGPLGQDPYLNAAIEVRTSWPPTSLLELCQRTERQAGRRRAERNGPRTLDIDLLLYESVVCDDATLTLPHPRMHQRRFVLEPLAEIAADMIHPTLHRTVAELLAALDLPEASGESCALVAGSDWDLAATSTD